MPAVVIYANIMGDEAIFIKRARSGPVPYDLIWNPEPGGNVEHIAEHDLTPDDIESRIILHTQWLRISAVHLVGQ